MSHTTRLAAMALLCILSYPRLFGQDGEGTLRSVHDGILSFGHDSDCPGCRAFLAGYGTAPAMHSPGCSCNGTLGAGDGGLGDSSAGAGGGPGDGAQFADDFQQLAASDVGAGLAYESAAPGMVGDFFGTSYGIAFQNPQDTLPPPPEPGDYRSVAVAGGDRRFKLADNASPFPIDRVFFNYNHFHNSLTTIDGRSANLNRGVAGFEKTFFDRFWSFEFRLPFSSALNGDQILGPPDANNVSNSVGNIAFSLKRLLFRTNTVAAAAGVGVVLPTGSDGRYFDGMNGPPTLIYTVENTGYYFLPYAGLWLTPNDRLFSQLGVQADIDARGNSVVDNQRGVRMGVIQDQTLLFLDGSFGYWIFRDLSGDRLLTGIAPMIEFHYTTTLTDTDTVALNRMDSITNPYNRIDVLNLTGAIRCEFGGRSYLTFSGVSPVRTGADKPFDAEFAVQYTRFF